MDKTSIFIVIIAIAIFPFACSKSVKTADLSPPTSGFFKYGIDYTITPQDSPRELDEVERTQKSEISGNLRKSTKAFHLPNSPLPSNLPTTQPGTI